MSDYLTTEVDAMIVADMHHLEDDESCPASVYWRMAELARHLERELADAMEQRDALATICGELIAAVRLNAMRDTFREATVDQIDEWLARWVDKLAAVKGEQL
jgi:predicted class III extradiol MEMO1 family dioxygenase